MNGPVVTAGFRASADLLGALADPAELAVRAASVSISPAAWPLLVQWLPACFAAGERRATVPASVFDVVDRVPLPCSPEHLSCGPAAVSKFADWPEPVVVKPVAHDARVPIRTCLRGSALSTRAVRVGERRRGRSFCRPTSSKGPPCSGRIRVGTRSPAWCTSGVVSCPTLSIAVRVVVTGPTCAVYDRRRVPLGSLASPDSRRKR